MYVKKKKKKVNCSYLEGNNAKVKRLYNLKRNSVTFDRKVFISMLFFKVNESNLFLLFTLHTGEDDLNAEEDEEVLTLLYDPCLNCYFDPNSGKYYELA